MTIARISELERKTTQSGKANAGKWIVEFERKSPQSHPAVQWLATAGADASTAAITRPRWLFALLFTPSSQ